MIGRIACALLVGMIGVRGPAVGQKLRLSYVSALPEQCKDGCSLEMITPKVGWLEGRRALWATTNGGVTWQQRPLPQTIGIADYVRFHFVDERRGWFFAAPNKLYKTSDRAATWVLVSLPRIDGIIHAAWLLLDSGLCWLAGGIYKPSTSPDAPNYAVKKYESGGWGILQPAVFFRQDSGAWRSQELPACSWHVDRVQFWDDRHGFALGDGCFYYTETGGRTWAVGVFTAGSESVPGYPDEAGRPTVFFLDSANGWLALDDGSLYRTKDGGAHWLQIASAETLRFSALRFLDETRGLAIGSGSKLYQSRDGGSRWSPVATAFWPRALDSLRNRAGWVLSDKELYRFALE